MAIQRDTLLGLVFFAGLGLIGWATVELTNLALFADTHRVVARFDNAQGLRTGDAVFVLGKRIGEVTEVAWDPSTRDKPIRVVLELTEQVELTAAARVEIRAASLLGGNRIEIDPGASQQPAPDPIQGEVRTGLLDSLGVGEVDLEGTIASIKTVFDKLADPNGSVGALLDSREAYDDLAATLRSLRNIFAQVESGEGTLGRVIYSADMANDLSGAITDLRAIADKINQGDGLVSRLLNDPEMAADLAAALSDVRELTAMTRRGEGLLGRVFTSEELAGKLDDIVASLQSVAQKLDDPDAGLVGALVGDEELLARGRSFIDQLDEVVTKINEGDGMFAKLINDPAMGERLERLFDQVAGALEDAREAAPIGTFFQVLAGPF